MSDLIPDLRERNEQGWYYIYNLLAFILLNFTIIFIQIGKLFLKSATKIYKKIEPKIQEIRKNFAPDPIKLEEELEGLDAPVVANPTEIR